MNRLNKWFFGLALAWGIGQASSQANVVFGLKITKCADDVVICANDPVQTATFTVTALGYPPLPGNILEFTWRDPSNAILQVVNVVGTLQTTGYEATSTVTVSAAGVYNVTVRAGAGLTATCSPKFTINPAPSISVAGASLCGSGPVTLTADTTADTVTWSAPGMPNFATGKTVTVTPTATTEYTITAQNEFGCSTTTTATVTVITPPTLEVANEEICLGDSVTLVAVTDAPVEWSTGDTTKEITVTPTALGNFTFTVTAGTDECSVTKTITVTVRNCVTNPGTGTPGYWMNHPKAWPVEAIVIGGVSYDKPYAIRLMKKSTSKDLTYQMFAHLVCAKLNVMIGNDPSCISSTISAADAWMTVYPPGGGVTGSSAAWKQGEPLKNTMDAYNNGKLCAPHRD